MRRLKKEILDLLGQEDQDQVVSVLLTFKARVIVNPLFSLIQETDEKIRENAARAMGQVVAKLAREQMEAARIVMRRLMWNLNDESGGIGWGSPEAMAEIMVCSEPLAREYLNILLSYVNPDGNYLEYEPLRKGAINGLRRLADKRPELMAPYLKQISRLS